MESLKVLGFISLFLKGALNAEALVTATISPNGDYNAPLNESFLIRTNCTGNGSIIVWLVDGSVINNEIKLDRGVSFIFPSVDKGGGLFFSSLWVPASEVNNMTSIRCVVVRHEESSHVPESAYSSLVFLNIQGLLAPPPNIAISEVDVNGKRILSWDAQETLDLTDFEPDILFYTVCCNHTGDLVCVNVSKREYKFSNIRVPLLFTVAAVNVVGEGNASCIVYNLDLPLILPIL